MIDLPVLITTVVVLLIAWIIASIQKNRGFFFWRAFFFAILALTMVAFAIFKTVQTI